MIHCDLAGPINPVSINNLNHANNLDDFSNIIWAYFLKNKSNACAAPDRFLADTSPYESVESLRCDNGGEFFNSKFHNSMLKNKIKREFSYPFLSFQNRTSERSWRTLFYMAQFFFKAPDIFVEFRTKNVSLCT